MSSFSMLTMSSEELKKVAAKALNLLTRQERAAVLCWYCPECHAYIPPGGKHPAGCL